MGLEVGFSFYKLKSYTKEARDNGLRVEAEPFNVVLSSDEGTTCNYLSLCGRCKVTSRFTTFADKCYNCVADRMNVIMNTESKTMDIIDKCVVINPKYMDDTVLEIYDKQAPDNEKYSYYRLSYHSIEELEKILTLDEIKKEHSEEAEQIETTIKEYYEQIHELREFQIKAETNTAFEGFQNEINKLKEQIEEQNEALAEAEEDYEYEHAVRLKEMIEQVKSILKENNNIVVTVFASY